MRVFIDTSAFLAFLDADDAKHQEARVIWQQLLSQNHVLVCHNYILLETIALIQRRFGLEAVQAFHDAIFPLPKIEWIDETFHTRGITAVLVASRKKLSLVDCVSFEVMRHLDLSQAFCFDKHFAQQGFEILSPEKK